MGRESEEAMASEIAYNFRGCSPNEQDRIYRAITRGEVLGGSGELRSAYDYGTCESQRRRLRKAGKRR